MHRYFPLPTPSIKLIQKLVLISYQPLLLEPLNLHDEIYRVILGIFTSKILNREVPLYQLSNEDDVTGQQTFYFYADSGGFHRF